MPKGSISPYPLKLSTKTLMASALAVCLLSVAYAKGDAKVTYVGGGRYACQGDSYKCAQIDQANQRESDRQRQEYQREQERAQDYVDRERRRQDENTRREYGR